MVPPTSFLVNIITEVEVTRLVSTVTVPELFRTALPAEAPVAMATEVPSS